MIIQDLLHFQSSHLCTCFRCAAQTLSAMLLLLLAVDVASAQVKVIPYTGTQVSVEVTDSIFAPDSSPNEADHLHGVLVLGVSNEQDGSKSVARVLEGTNFYKSQGDTWSFTSNPAVHELHVVAITTVRKPDHQGTYTVTVNGVPHTLDLSNVLYLEEFPELGEDLVAYYPFNGNALDESSNGNHGTVNGATLTTDRFGNQNSAYTFDGVDDFVQIASSPVIEGVTNEISLVAWVKREIPDLSSGFIVSKRASAHGPMQFTIKLPHPASNGFSFQFDGQNQPAPGYSVYRPQIDANDVVNDGNWHQVAVTYQYGVGAAPQLYVDGLPIPGEYQFGSGDYPAISGGGDLLLGKQQVNTSPGYYNGLLDDVRIYSRALTESEILDLCQEDGWPCASQAFTISDVDADATGPYNWGDQITFTITLEEADISQAAIEVEDLLRSESTEVASIPDGSGGWNLTYTTTVPPGTANGTYDVTFTASNSVTVQVDVQNRVIAGFYLDDTEVQWDQLTDLFFAFAQPTYDGNVTFAQIDDAGNVEELIQNRQKMLEQLAFSGSTHGVRVHLTFGGATQGDVGWSYLLTTESFRQSFAEAVAYWVETLNLDGINLDWEFPDASEAANYADLAQRVRTELNGLEAVLDKELFLSASVVSLPGENSDGITTEFIEQMDYLLLMAYDGNDCPLCGGDNPSSVEHAENATDFWTSNDPNWKGEGRDGKTADPAKLILGIPFYGKNTDDGIIELYQVSSSLDPDGFFNDDDGYRYKHLYNSCPLIVDKSKMLEEKGGAGLFAWQLSGDRNDEYSLLACMNSAMYTEGNLPPFADAGLDRETLPFLNVQLDGTGSNDPEGTELTYVWSLLEHPQGSVASLSDPTLENPIFTPDVAGTYVFRLNVDDGSAFSFWPPGLVTISVLTPAEAAQNLIDVVSALDIPGLGSQLNGVPKKLSDDNPHNDNAAIGKLNAFINQVEAKRGKKLSDEQADALIAVAQAILDSLSSSSKRGSTAVSPTEQPASFHLAPNYPNPFNPSTEIRFDLPEAVHVRFSVYDVTGRQVAILQDGPMPAGRHAVTFDAQFLPSGVYVYRLDAGSFTQTRHMVLLK